jgi:hypothetical protein
VAVRVERRDAAEKQPFALNAAERGLVPVAVAVVVVQRKRKREEKEKCEVHFDGCPAQRFVVCTHCSAASLLHRSLCAQK